MYRCSLNPGGKMLIESNRMSCDVTSYKMCFCVRLSDSITGVLHISNHSETFAGMYRCEARNAVGTENCTFALRAEKRKPTHTRFTLTSCTEKQKSTHTRFTLTPCTEKQKSTYTHTCFSKTPCTERHKSTHTCFTLTPCSEKHKSTHTCFTLTPCSEKHKSTHICFTCVQRNTNPHTHLCLNLTSCILPMPSRKKPLVFLRGWNVLDEEQYFQKYIYIFIIDWIVVYGSAQ